MKVCLKHLTGIGGDCFCMLHVPGQPVWGYNGSGRTVTPAVRGQLGGRCVLEQRG